MPELPHIGQGRSPSGCCTYGQYQEGSDGGRASDFAVLVVPNEFINTRSGGMQPKGLTPQVLLEKGARGTTELVAQSIVA
jgi:hypothetical protein